MNLIITLQKVMTTFTLFQLSFNTPWHEAIARPSPPLSFETVWMAHCQQVHWQKPTNLIVNKKHFVIVSASNISLSFNGQPQSSVFQSHCVCCHFNQCVGAAVLSHFCPLSNLLLIGKCHFFVACAMSCVCVWLVRVCCVTSSDGVWGVDDAVCVSLSTPKKGSTAHSPVCI